MKRINIFILTLILALVCIGCTKQNNQDPVIVGATDIEYVIGDERPDFYRGISVDDEEDGNIIDALIIDDSAVDFNTVGTYTVTYMITDSDGNIARESITVTVTNVNSNTTFDLYYLNDFHGAILSDDEQIGFANIANLVMTSQDEKPNQTMFITGGDMLQGALLSNYYDGASVIEMLNLMGLDAFVIGNHEFDWGLDVILQYFDQDSDAPVHANFPLLGANVIEKATGERPDGMDAYTIIEKQGYKIGVIGTIGYGLESSIAASRVADYEFQEPVAWTEYYATYLRTIENVDIVISVNHGDSDYFNQSVADLAGDARVDAIFNGHSHQQYINDIRRDSVDTFAIQAGANGEAVGYAEFTLIDGVLDDVSASILDTTTNALLNDQNADMVSLITSYSEDIDDLINESIITAGDYISTSELTTYMAKIMQVKTNSDIAFHNYGGTRTSIAYNEAITVAKAYDIFPFDNVIMTTEILGSDINALMGSLGHYPTDQTFDDNTYYKVATNDYVFTNNYYVDIFENGMNFENTGLLLRDLFIQVLEDLSDDGHLTFTIDLEIPEPLSIDTYTILHNKDLDPFHVIINA